MSSSTGRRRPLGKFGRPSRRDRRSSGRSSVPVGPRGEAWPRGAVSPHCGRSDCRHLQRPGPRRGHPRALPRQQARGMRPRRRARYLTPRVARGGTPSQ
eukprot:scaffold5078_cov63-Phaeocystis_antarctica.AAC.3